MIQTTDIGAQVIEKIRTFLNLRCIQDFLNSKPDENRNRAKIMFNSLLHYLTLLHRFRLSFCCYSMLSHFEQHWRYIILQFSRGRSLGGFGFSTRRYIKNFHAFKKKYVPGSDLPKLQVSSNYVTIISLIPWTFFCTGSTFERVRICWHFRDVSRAALLGNAHTCMSAKTLKLCLINYYLSLLASLFSIIVLLLLDVASFWTTLKL